MCHCVRGLGYCVTVSERSGSNGAMVSFGESMDARARHYFGIDGRNRGSAGWRCGVGAASLQTRISDGDRMRDGKL